MREFNEAIRLNPDYAEAYFNRGKTRLEQGNIERALRDFNEAIRLKPDYDVDAFYSRAFARGGAKDRRKLCSEPPLPIIRSISISEAVYTTRNQSKVERDHPRSCKESY